MSAVLQANLISQPGTGGGGGETKCANVVIDPTNGDAPQTVTLITSTSGAHIFYTFKHSAIPTDPTHSGDNATGTTIRIGSNAGTFETGSGGGWVKALAYKSGLLDSDITQGGQYTPSGGGGGF